MPGEATARAGHELGWSGGGKQTCRRVPRDGGLCPAVLHLPPSACCCAGRREPSPHPLCSRAVQKAAGSCREPACLACRRECGAKPCLVPRSSRPGAANCCWKELGESTAPRCSPSSARLAPGCKAGMGFGASSTPASVSLCERIPPPLLLRPQTVGEEQ